MEEDKPDTGGELLQREKMFTEMVAETLKEVLKEDIIWLTEN